MAIFKCDSCGYERDVPDKLSGKKAKCPDCGHGVTIVDFASKEDESFTSLFDETETFEENFADDSQQNEDFNGESMESIDLDGTDAMDVDLSEDVICSHCGHVMPDSNDGVCAQCGKPIDLAKDLPEITEDNIDVSDLAQEEVPQVWESDYPGNEEGAGVSFVEDDEEESSWRLFEGSLPLNVFAGTVSGFLAFFFAVSMSLLASSQAGMHDFLPYILATSLTGMVIGSLFFSIDSKFSFALAGPETVVTAVLFIFLGTLYRDMAESSPFEFILPTIIAAIATTALIVGFGLWLLGKLQAGKYVRFIPIQIIGGVIGGVGVFVLLGTFDWMGNLALDWNNLFVALKECVLHLQSAEYLYTMGPSIAFGLVLFVGLAKCKNSLFLLAILLVASAIGYAAGVWGPDNSVKSLAATIPYLEDGVPLFPVQLLKSDFGNIQWSIIKANGLYIGALAVLIILTTMYRVTGLEIIQGRESDIDGEYRSLGLTNIIVGLCGGMPVSLSYGRSAGNRASGARGPIAGVVAGLICGAALFYIDFIIPLIPRFVPEGLLFYAGFALVRDWLFKAKTSFTRSDDLWMLWITFLVTVTLGMLEGIGFGVALALMVTVSRNSKGGTIRNVLSGVNHRSNVDRAPAQQRTLKEFGDHIYILRLQGFIFLGSMASLLKDIHTRLGNRDLLPVEYLVLDFKMVTGLASAAGIGFDKLRNLVDEHGIELIITSAPLELEEHLEESGHVGEGEGMFKVFFNLDYALEWCENHVLDSENMLEMKQLELPELLGPVFPEPKYIPALMKVLRRVVVGKGEAVFRQGDDSDSMYFVESGRLDVELELEGGKLLRLKKVGPGAVFGEMGIYTMAPRSATIRAAEKCVLYMMTTEKLDAVEKRAPMLVTTIHRFMINMLSERLGEANTKVRDLMM